MSKQSLTYVLKLGAVAAAFHFGGPWAAVAVSGLWGVYEYEKVKSSASLIEEQQGIQVNTTSNENALPICYGLCKVGVSLVDVRQSANDSNILAVVGAIAIAPEGGSSTAQQGINSVEKVYFDEKLALSAPEFGTNSSGNNPMPAAKRNVIQLPWSGTDATSGSSVFGSTYFLDFFMHDGDDSQTVDYKLSSTDQGWPTDSSAPYTSYSRGVGISYIVLWMYLDDEAYSNGLPNVTCEIQGNKVPDCTDLTNDYRYSTNPADCIYDYMTSKRYGMGIPTADMDATSFAAAASYCNDEVTITLSTGTATLADRFTCNGWLDSSADPKTNLERLLSSCQGRIVREGGKYKLLIRQTKSAETFELNRTNIVGEWSFLRTGSDQSPNVMKATFVDADMNFQPDTVAWPGPGASNTYLTEDNSYLVEGSIELPFTTNRYMAEMITAQTLLENRADMACTVVAQREALKLAVGDVVNVNHDTPSWTDQTMWVEEIGLRRDGLVVLGLKEYAAASYTVPTMPVKETLISSELPALYARAPSSRVAVLNMYWTPGDGIDASAYARQVDLNINFSVGLGSFKVTVDPDNASAHNYTVNHSTANYNARLMESDGSTPFEFGATVPGSNTATTYPESPCDVTITPYSGASLGGTAGEAVTMTIELDDSVGAVGVRVQATTLASVVIPGNKLLVPQTGGLLAGIGTNNDPSISLNITGVATGSAADNTNDYLIYYDAAAGALRKVAIDGLPYEPLS
jgi:hypothetical protein